MNILITGASGFVGRNLVENLKNIRNGKNRTRPELKIDEIFCFDVDSDENTLTEYCEKAGFIFNLAGVNRPKDNSEYESGNELFLSHLLDLLEKAGNSCPVMISSSAQASLEGRFAGSIYGKSKLKAENILLAYAEKSGSKVLPYRFPNIFGKWCRPNYNSAVATFCYNTANDLPISINDPKTELELLYIDDLVDEMLDALEGKEHRCEFDGLKVVENENGRYCFAPITHKATLGEIAGLLERFVTQPLTLVMPKMPNGSFAKKLFSTYLSYLPESKTAFKLKMNCDSRGSFTELLKTADNGQFSVNISKPGITKGQHWHNSKWEQFIVVSGKGLIQLRQIGNDIIREYYVSGDEMTVVQMLPGYTHNIINLSETEPLVTLMWANEQFDPNHPDTFGEPV